MHSFYLIALFPVASFATLYGHCSGTSAGGKATGDYLTDGICDYTSDCTARGGSHISNGCPDDGNSITCCLIGLADSGDTNPCGSLSFCDWTANSDCKNTYGGTFKSGYCPGGSNYECCKF